MPEANQDNRPLPAGHELKAAIDEQFTQESFEDEETSSSGMLVRRTWAGIIPPSEELRTFDRVRPGTSDDIVRWADQSLQHEREMEKEALALEREKLALTRTVFEYDFYRVTRAQNFSFCVILAGIIAFMTVAIAGHPVEATVIGGMDLVGAAAVFFYDRISHKSGVKAAGRDTEADEDAAEQVE